MTFCLLHANDWCMRNCKGKDENDECILFKEQPEKFMEVVKMPEQCDVCGRELSSDYIIDNDVLMCPRCFLEVYKKSIEDLIGVVVVIGNERGGER